LEALLTTVLEPVERPRSRNLRRSNALITRGSSRGRILHVAPGGKRHSSIGTDDVVITVMRHRTHGSNTFAVAANVAPIDWSLQPLRRDRCRNSAGNPLGKLWCRVHGYRSERHIGQPVTNASGVATFTYGARIRTDSVSARVRSTATINNNSNVVPMTWTLTAQSPPVVQGWIASRERSTITGRVPITVGAGSDPLHRPQLNTGRLPTRPRSPPWPREYKVDQSDARYTRHDADRKWQLCNPRNCHRTRTGRDRSAK